MFNVSTCSEVQVWLWWRWTDVLLWSILSTTLHLVVPDPHPPSRPLPPPPREDRQQKPATPPTGAASHQQPTSAAPQPQQRNSHIFKPMVRSLYSVLLLDCLAKPPWNMETWPDKWTALCRFPSITLRRGSRFTSWNHVLHGLHSQNF
jgi:hypothetical protein